jgi:threonine/homoserine/homoserine lactone efflux protein
MLIDPGLILRGILIGFTIAAPVGPIGVLCIRRTLAHGRLNGFVSGLGAASADAVYGCVAAFGLTFISELLIQLQIPLRLTGGLYLLYLGARTFLAQPAAVDSTTAATAPVRGLAGAYASTLALTLTNPMTILSFVAIFAGLGAGAQAGGSNSAALLVLGVFAGSALWWLLLTAGSGLLRSRLLRSRLQDARAMRWVNRLSGLIIAGFGIAAFVSALGVIPR